MLKIPLSISDQRLHILLRVEGLHVVDTLPQANKLHRHLELLGNGNNNATLGGAVQLRENNPGTAGDLLELLGLDEAVLPGATTSKGLTI